MPNIKQLTKRIIAFRNARNWAQFHKPKDIAISLMLEAGELLEHFQWKTDKEIKEYVKNNKATAARRGPALAGKKLAMKWPMCLITF